MISNLKESAIPYLIEQLRLARLSFELFGALSPSEARPAPGEETTLPRSDSQDTGNGSAADENAKSDDKDENARSTDGAKGIKQPRNVSQAELESSLYRVGHPANSLLSDVTFKVWSRLRRLLFYLLSIIRCL